MPRLLGREHDVSLPDKFPGHEKPANGLLTSTRNLDPGSWILDPGQDQTSPFCLTAGVLHMQAACRRDGLDFQLPVGDDAGGHDASSGGETVGN